MAFRWQWLLIWAVFWTVGEQSVAAATRADRAYAAAVSAFQDGMWSRAEMALDRFVQKYPDSRRVAEAVLLQAEAQFKQGKLTNAVALLTARKAGAGDLADQYAYWIGEAQFQGGDLSAAAETFVSLTRDFPESPLCLRALVEAAAAQAQLAQWPQLIALLEPTNSMFQRTARTDPVNELVVRGSLLLAQAKFAQKDFAGAAAILESLASPALKPELDWQRVYLLYQTRRAAGDTNAALADTTNLVQIARSATNDARQAEGLALRADALEQLRQTAGAAATYQEILALNAPADRQRQAILKIAELAIAQNQFSNAVPALEKFLAQFPDSPAGDVALLTLGELHLMDYTAQLAVTNPSPALTNLLPAAQACFDKFLPANTNSPLLTNSPLAGKAWLDRGWCLWLAGKTNAPETLDAFRAAALRLPPSKDLAEARFKIGDVLFARKDFTNALDSYRQVVEDFADLPAGTLSLGDRALYQMLCASLELKDLAGASNTLARILTDYPASDLADSSVKMVGESLVDACQPAAARDLFRKFEELFPNSPLRPQAEYALAGANFQAGNETNAFRLFTNFVAQFPTNELAPLAQWWVADYYFRLGGTNYIDAERNYKILYQNTNWQALPLVYTNLAFQARLMAGHAAMGLSSYTDAKDHFISLTSDTNCPAELNAQALFAYGRVLMQMDPTDTNHPLANFQLATNVFSQICQLYPTNESGVLAWNEIGDCDLQLANYDGATNAYAQVFNSPHAGTSARSRAQIGFGIALEKKAALAAGEEQKQLLQLALGNYLDVFETWTGKNLRDGEVADLFWVKESGLRALPLIQSLGVAPPEKFIDTMETLLPQLKDSLEKKKAAMLSTKN